MGKERDGNNFEGEDPIPKFFDKRVSEDKIRWKDQKTHVGLKVNRQSLKIVWHIVNIINKCQKAKEYSCLPCAHGATLINALSFKINCEFKISTNVCCKQSPSLI